MNASKGPASIVPSSIDFALRQNGSFSSLKIRVRQARIDVDDLLELVDDEGGATVPGAAELGRELEQPLQGRVDVGGFLADPKGEGE